MQAGIHASIPMGLYQSDPCDAPSLSNGIIKTLLGKSPAHARLEHPRLTPQPVADDEAKFDLGTAAHALFLEGVDCMVPLPYDDWRTKEARSARDQVREQGRIPLLAAHAARVLEMVGVARDYMRDTPLGDILSDGRPEVSCFWQDPVAGIWCRTRPDWLVTDYSIVLDYKTTSCVNPAQFCRTQVVAMGYDTAASFYRRGIRALTRRDPRYVFLVQEEKPPYSCYLVECAPSMAEVADHKVQRAINLWAECLATDTWPGYSQHIYHAEAQAWMVEQEVEAQ